MKTSSRSAVERSRYHQDAYQFVFDALWHAQQLLGAPAAQAPDLERHITGPELLEGIRDMALERFGLMTQTVFRHWGVRATEDFGRIVFELIERGEMRKTEQDQLEDFCDVYDFDEEFDRRYRVDTRPAFR
jgi:uncharacterized repeat protein (TIGR04138 family)